MILPATETKVVILDPKPKTERVLGPQLGRRASCSCTMVNQGQFTVELLASDRG
jgi:hypothetical protein